jgi:hypothetical protein
MRQRARAGDVKSQENAMSRSLERLQAEFAEAMADPLRAADFAVEIVVRDLGTLDRLALYRGNVHAAWEKALANSYPVVRALVGEEFFGGLARAYGRAHPSTSGDLNRFGAHYADFVRDFEHTQSLPYLPDVAALEWSVHGAHCAGDAFGLSRDRIGALPPSELLASRFTLHPACTTFESRFPAASIWLAHQPNATVALPTDLDRREFALVIRPGWRVEVLVTSAGEVAALKHLGAGADMECAIGVALAIEPQFNFARALVRWLDNAVLVDMQCGTSAKVCESA